MSTTQHVCKYDPEHGVFVTPPKLAEHYREFHGDVWVPKPDAHPDRKFRCRLCGGLYRNPSSHMHQKHAERRPPFVAQYFEIVDGGNPVPRPPANPERQAVDIVDPSPRHVGPWTVDDVVLPVVEQLAGPRAVIPVAHLAAILVWRDATAVMLRAVTS